MQHTNIKKEATCLSMIKEVDEGGRSDSPRNNRQLSLNTNGYRQLHAIIFALSSCTYAYTYPCMRLQSMDLYTHHLNEASYKTYTIRIILLVIDPKKKKEPTPIHVELKIHVDIRIITLHHFVYKTIIRVVTSNNVYISIDTQTLNILQLIALPLFFC